MMGYKQIVSAIALLVASLVSVQGEISIRSFPDDSKQHIAGDIVIVSLISGGKGYPESAIALCQSCKKHVPNIPRLLLVQENSYPDYVIRKMKTVGWEVSVVPRIEVVQTRFSAKRWVNVFTKFHAWDLDADKVLFLDADCFVNSSEVASLFDLDVELAACHTADPTHGLAFGLVYHCGSILNRLPLAPKNAVDLG